MNASFFAKTLPFPHKIPTNEEIIIFLKTITQSRVYKTTESFSCIFIPEIFYKFSFHRLGVSKQTGLSSLTDRINHLSVFIDHVQTQLFLIGRNQRETGFTATELGPVDGFHLTA